MVATGFRSASAWTRIPKPRPGLKPSQGSIRITSRRCCHALRCWWTRRCVRIGHACWSGRDRRRELPNGLLYVMDVARTKKRTACPTSALLRAVIGYSLTRMRESSTTQSCP